jgi:hypothetical protein
VSFIGILRSVGDGVRAVTTEAPQWALSRRGRIPGAPRALYKTPTVMLCLQRKSSALCARKYGFVGCFGRGEQLLVATSSSFSKGAFQNDICRFESCFFRVCENRRHSRGLGWRARVSGRQIPDFRLWTGGFCGASLCSPFSNFRFGMPEDRFRELLALTRP